MIVNVLIHNYKFVQIIRFFFIKMTTKNYITVQLHLFHQLKKKGTIKFYFSILNSYFLDFLFHAPHQISRINNIWIVSLLVTYTGHSCHIFFDYSPRKNKSIKKSFRFPPPSTLYHYPSRLTRISLMCSKVEQKGIRLLISRTYI